MSKILRVKDVEEKIGLSRSTIYDRCKKGLFPRRLKLNGGLVGWLESEIDDWINDLAQKNRVSN